ncbi:hypothetical protein J2W21_000639 [Sinomonas atrocyanea]|uniref:SRPBCC family protein n=1 Tax=Sinomonas atrocyanea TaxID=37927 RepID=UPI0027885217|nr:SRPBCC family protein [Sinomonas atrocyanea]MDP9883149.1 hypothetical protein [Sinomonas atrocyanea]
MTRVRRVVGFGCYEFVASVAIGRPATEVYAFLADVQDAKPLPRRPRVWMVKEPDGPTGAGTRWHERVGVLPGVWMRVESVVTEADEPIRLGMDFRSPWFAGHTVYELTPTFGGCVLRHREGIRPIPPLAVLCAVLGRSRRQHVEERLADIKAVLEGEGSRGSMKWSRGHE